MAVDRTAVGSGVAPSRRRAAHALGLAGLLLLVVPTTAAALPADAPSSAADTPGRGRGCVWTAANEGAAAQALLAEWAATEGLPRIDRWDVSLDGARARVGLHFASGHVSLSWTLDARCDPTGMRGEASAGYSGRRPDAAAIRRLAVRLRGSATAEHVARQRADFEPWTVSAAPSAMVAAVGAALALCGLLPLARRRGIAIGLPPGVSTAALVRSAGVVGIVVLLPYQSPPDPAQGPGAWIAANGLVLLGVLPLTAFLWLVASGWCGYGGAERADWPALLALVAALVAAEAFTLHANEELQLHFFSGRIPGKNSLVHALVQAFVTRLVPDAYAAMTHVNGVLHAVATLPLFLFVRRRTGSRVAALVIATCFGLQPVVLRFAPTDSPYAMIFATWFAGLALLSVPAPAPRQLVGGTILLGIAATCRPEGVLYLVASLLVLDLRALLQATNAHRRAAALALAGLAGLLAAHWYYCLPLHLLAGGPFSPAAYPTDHLSWHSFRHALLGPVANPLLFRALIVAGAVAGLADRRLRVGLGAALGSLVLVLPMTQSVDTGIVTLHRLVPVCGLEAIAAGVGAYWLGRVLAGRRRDGWWVAVPGLVLALAIVVPQREELRVRYVFNQEYDLVRHRLAPGGVSDPHCVLLWFSPVDDSGLHSFRHVVPGMHAVDCRFDDCRSVVEQEGWDCIYYVRSASCIAHPDGVPPPCRARGITADGDRLACLTAPCADLERDLRLSLIEERTVYPQAVWGRTPMAPRFPEQAEIALYRVRGVRADGAGR